MVASSSTSPVEQTLSEENKTPLKIAAWIALGLGVVALLSPLYAGLAATLVLGVNFLVGGVLEAVAAFRAQRWSGTLGLILLALVSIIAGLIIFAHPLLGLATITLVCIAAMFVAGIAKTFWAFKVPSGSGRWMLALSGILSVLVAGMLYTSFPFSAAWAFGVLVGVNLIVEGATLLGYLSRSS
jgi:uncharacterized membrane protein HdeD (DUF308 family)